MSATGQLFINGREVGNVMVKSMADSWGIGEFVPGEGFAEFAPIFGNWSLLMHADDNEERLSEAASEELRRAEYALDAMRAKLRLHADQEWVDISQLNIDGSLIEWKIDRRDAEPASSQ